VGMLWKYSQTIDEPVGFLLPDNNFSNYLPCFQANESRLVDGATIIADNLGIGAKDMADYLVHVHPRYESKTSWFDTDLR